MTDDERGMLAQSARWEVAQFEDWLRWVRWDCETFDLEAAKMAFNVG